MREIVLDEQEIREVVSAAAIDKGILLNIDEVEYLAGSVFEYIFNLFDFEFLEDDEL